MKQIYSGLILAAALTLSACASHTAGISVSSQGETRVDNSSFARNIAVENVDARRIADVIQASALVVSKSSTDMRVQYKFTWYDASGFTIEDEATSWKSVKLHGKQQLQVTAVAPNSQAVRFDVYVRETFSN
ncbi:YcfL family protein [Shewanella glacialipiscicola]|uniref:YcfL family protein n=1 Tax=Shewanella TaxID=22 RepID=UPI0021DB56C2|nr:YcfL family protein [Shewanella glacialipiscicola]MCU7993590.1 YcfL family protein [Shewanella glacialipiscicola]MCU8024908.1 YcfL family protein [Shewanella glacialipiscicola]